jgi:hypothetical protein
MLAKSVSVRVARVPRCDTGCRGFEGGGVKTTGVKHISERRPSSTQSGKPGVLARRGLRGLGSWVQSEWPKLCGFDTGLSSLLGAGHGRTFICLLLGGGRRGDV